MAIFCDSCGQENRDGARFCRECKNNLLFTTEKGMLQIGVILDKRYEIKDIIEKGGMGTVYLAIDNRFQQALCAVKEMCCNVTDGEKKHYICENFKKEARMLHELRHPNLPVVKDYFIEGGRYYLVMDYIEGENLEAILLNYKDKGIKEKLVVEWSKQILSALSYLHNQNPPLIYRDLKPENIMLRKDGKIFLIDFGIARTIKPEENASITVIGTPPYCALEVFQGKGEKRSDIYALGGTMHALLTGKIPQKPLSFDPVERIKPDISQELAKIVTKALEMNIKYRYTSVSEMIDDLEKLNLKNKSDFRNGKKENILKDQIIENILPRNSEISLSEPDNSRYENKTKEKRKTEIITVKQYFLNKVNYKLFLFLSFFLFIIIIISGLLSNHKDSNDFYQKGIIFSENGDYNEAIRCFDKALKLNPGWPGAIIAKRDALKMKGEYLKNTGDYEKAIKIFDEVLQIEPDFLPALNEKRDVLVYMGKDFTDKGQFDRAFICYDRALNIKPQKGTVWNLKGDLFFTQKKYDEAIKCYNRATEITPDYSIAWYNKGKVSGVKGDFTSAVKYFDKALLLDSKNKEAWNGKGTALYMEKKYEDAIKCYNRAIQIDPLFVKAIDNKGLVLYSSGNYTEAIKYFDRALKLDPLFVKSWANKGNTFYEQGNLSEAIRCYNKALSIDPYYKTALINRENALKYIDNNK